MNKKLKKEIIKWFWDNENEFQRINKAAEVFRQYIFNSNGNFIHGGKDVYNFLAKVDNFLY